MATGRQSQGHLNGTDMRAIVRAGYERGDYAGVYRRDDRLSALQAHFLEVFRRLLPPSPRVLDLGCGTGIPFTRWLVESGCAVMGIDFSPKHISAARTNVPLATFIEGDYTAVDLPGAFDGVVAFYSVFHIPKGEHAALFARLSGLLKTHGVVLVTLGNAEGESLEEWCGARMAWSSLSPEAYERLLGETGFRLVEAGWEGERGAGEYHRWLLARKDE